MAAAQALLGLVGNNTGDAQCQLIASNVVGSMLRCVCAVLADALQTDRSQAARLLRKLQRSIETNTDMYDSCYQELLAILGGIMESDLDDEIKKLAVASFTGIVPLKSLRKNKELVT